MMDFKAFSVNFLKMTFYNTTFTFSLPSSEGNFRDTGCTMYWILQQLVFRDEHL